MRPVKVTSKSLYETSAVSLFAHLLTPALLAACMSRMQSCSFSILIFEQKRDCLQSKGRVGGGWDPGVAESMEHAHKMLQFVCWNLIENFYVRNTGNATR